MPNRLDSPDSDETPRPQAVVPAGAPSWVTPDLIEHTLRVWQPFYQQQLIPEDALEMIRGVAGIVEVLSSGADHETVRRISPRQQP
jgi:hypothetical protein